MKLSIVPRRRLPEWPGWAFLVLGGYALLITLGLGLEAWLHRSVETCVFHAVTGHPCPGCGSTRAFQCLARGEILQALGFNPLISATALIGFSCLLFRAATGRWIQAEFSRTERRVLLGIGIAGFAANWVWLLLTLP